MKILRLTVFLPGMPECELKMSQNTYNKKKNSNIIIPNLFTMINNWKIIITTSGIYIH
jgi:hypothetical protein